MYLRHPGRRAVVVLALVGTSLLGWSAISASANTANLSVTDTAGQSDPAAGVPRVFTISGTVPVPSKVYVKYRSVGGAPCAASAAADTGTSSPEHFRDVPSYVWEPFVNGEFTSKRAATWSSPGPTQFCIWIVTAAENRSSIAPPITQIIDFRSPAASFSIGITPLTPLPQQPTGITISGTTEAPRILFAKVKRGAGCAPTFDSDGGDSVFGGSTIDGAFSLSSSITRDAGRYSVCAWLAGPDGQAVFATGPQEATFEVVPPPAPNCSVIDRSRKRGRSFRVRCQHVSDRWVRVQYKRGKRTVTRKVKHRAGQLQAPTRGLSYGAWRVAVFVDATRVKAGRVTVRRR